MPIIIEIITNIAAVMYSINRISNLQFISYPGRANIFSIPSIQISVLKLNII